MIRLLYSTSICKMCQRTIWTSRYLYCDVDYHKILGLDRNCNKKELKKRYVELSKKYHPDAVNSVGNLDKIDAKKQFQEINEAYRMLMKKYSKPKRVLVQTRGYQPKSEQEPEEVRSKTDINSQSVNPPPKSPLIDSHGWNLVFFLFVATLTIKIAIKEDGLLNTRRVSNEGHADEISDKIALERYSRNNITYFLIALPLLLLYWRYWNRFGRG